MKKSCVILLFLSLVLGFSAALAHADECDDLIEWEIVFSLAHDELIDYQTDDSLAVDKRITACTVYLSRIEPFIEAYPRYCDTQNSIKDLSEMRSNVSIIRDNLRSQ